MSAAIEYINPEGAPRPVGLYSHVARSGDLLLVAGQVGVNVDGSLAGEDLESQVIQTYENVRIVLESQGASLRHVLKFTTYLISEEDIDEFYAVRQAYFADRYADGSPPNTLLVVRRLLRPEFRVEIEAIARAA